MFNSKGQFKVTIKEAGLYTAKFHPDNPEVMDVGLHVETKDGQSDWWLSELSQMYGKGNAADKTQAEMTLASLERIGWNHGASITEENLQSLVGVETEVGTVENEYQGKTYYNVRYLGPSNFRPKQLSKEDAAVRLAAIFGTAATKPAADTGASDDSPFG